MKFSDALTEYLQLREDERADHEREPLARRADRRERMGELLVEMDLITNGVKACAPGQCVLVPDASQDVIDLRAVDRVLEDVLGDIAGWEDKALAEAVTDARAKLKRVAQKLVMQVTAGVGEVRSQVSGGQVLLDGNEP
jgi:hypothetical protein